MIIVPIVIGLNHTSAPLEIREQMSLSVDVIRKLLSNLPVLDGDVINEAVILSTCNRTELYCIANPKMLDKLFLWFAKTGSINPDVFRKHSYHYIDFDAVYHIFRVSSGLDSMVLGEPEILGQMKKAVLIAKEAKGVGFFFHRLFQDAFSVAKTVRTQTDIGRNSISIASSCLKLSSIVMNNGIQNAKVLFIGAGEMIELCIKHFSSVNFGGLVISNRTLAKSKNLADKFSIDFIPFEQIYDDISDFDIIISCTASNDFIIDNSYAEKLSYSTNKLMIDLAVPRDIDPVIGNLNNVKLYSIDDLASIIKQGLDARRASIPKADNIILAKVKIFMKWAHQRDLTLTITNLINKIENIKLLEIERANSMISKNFNKEYVISVMAHRLTKKFLHGLINAMKNSEEKDFSHIHGYLSKVIDSQDK
ncbi:glutamyl-tRNA reductase [Candidatus Kinetoplastidibacterium crithidiae]|uniref:Glutamyl-tRNA reductase n=2 Tax=Candidatus Kinetoplastidibacterium crithidiae TaxID=33056 RepID=M1LNV8_9PROT|nr:glutamyl-tRNA reductase [Candidatus Kinetoplastibacterium crithidii]AEM25284.1 glutamyl-tRNA reductase [Candidatus Kinetoplastibacterium crithidii]AFZ83095.1 glutamyl-tRNA reductase [Candidatus Kinetoplastibacterium crithidii (ex Angomonas deanei ATCC 30255)]AGF47372.1 glutamyl-tRNA reductase hemA [Candidatus Kinetoplastibacterium crithidii TCC036E]